MVPGQKANSNNLGKFYVECSHLSYLNEVILMSAHNIQFHDKIRNFS